MMLLLYVNSKSNSCGAHKVVPYIYKVYIPVMLSMCKETQKLAFLFDIFLKKACVVFKKALPLHPLSGTKFSGSN